MMIFLFGIIFYTYELVIDHQEFLDSDRVSDQERPFYETVWIYGLYVLLIIGFILSSYTF